MIIGWPFTILYYLFVRYELRLSPEEKELIKKHLQFYEDLDNSKRVATTEEQKQFMRVCSGDKRPTTVHERAYIKYRRLKNS